MNIVYVVELFHPNIGGVEKLFFSLAEKAAEKGDNVKVITTRFRNDLPITERLNGFEIIRINVRNRFLFTFFGYRYVKKHIRDADIIHTTSFNAAFPAYYAAKALKKKCIITYHEVWIDLWKNLPGLSIIEKYFFRIYEKRLVRLNFDLIVAPSIYTFERLKLFILKKERLKQIYNGIEYPEIVQNNSSDKKYIYFGRAGISKGLEMLIEAASAVNRQHGYKLHIMLPRDNYFYRKKIEKLVSTANAEDIITLNDSIIDQECFYKYISEFSFSVIPSFSEGFCFSAAESVALGIPVVSSGRGALKEVVSGRFITMKEYTTKELSDCLVKAFRNEWQVSEVKRFTSTACFDEYYKIYNEILNS